MDSTSANENQTSSRPSPVKNVNASPQVYVITPNQLAKLGLSTQIHSLIATQVQSKQTAVEMETIILDSNEEQSLSISSSTASHLDQDENYTLTESKMSNEARKSVNIENIKVVNTSSSLRNEMKSKLHHLLYTNESFASVPLVAENVNTSVIKDTNRIHILNYAIPTPSAKFGALHSTMADKKDAYDKNAMQARVSTTADQRLPGIEDGTEIRHRTLMSKHLSHDSIVKQQAVKPALRIVNSKSFTEATKTTPVKLEIVSNEVVNFSPLEIQNILKQNVTSQSKVTESIPQSTSNTINKTAYLQNSLCTQDSAASKVEKHFKKKLYETFHVADNAAVEKQSNDIDDKVIDLDNTPEECSDSRSQKVVEDDILSFRRLQTIKIGGSTKDKNSFLPPAKTYVVRQAQIQILNSSGPEQVKLECTDEGKTVSKKLPVRQEAQTDSTLDTNTKPWEKENKKAAIPINNNNTELKFTDNKSAQKLTGYPTLLNSLLQNRTYIGATSNINISDHTSIDILNHALGPRVQEKQPETDLESVTGNNSTEGQTEEIINTTSEFSEKKVPTEIVDENSVNERESENFASETSLTNDLQTELVRKVEKAPPPRILNLELQEKIDESQIEQETKVEKAPAPPPRVLNLELQERKKVITDKSFFDSAAASCTQKKEKLQTESCAEQQQSGTASVVLNSKLQQDLYKKVNTLVSEPSPTKSRVTQKLHYKLLSITKNENFRKDNTRCYGKSRTVSANSDSDKDTSDDDATTLRLKHTKKRNTSATVKKAHTLRSFENPAEKIVQQNLQSDVIIIDADETTPRRNTKREQEGKTLTLKTPADVDLYVQSKTSGRKRKYVDYKLLSGISRYSSSDSDSADEESPPKKCPDTNNQNKSTTETNPVKKRGRGRPRKSEIKPIEVQVDTSDDDVKTENQCYSPNLDEHIGQGDPIKSEIKQSEFNEQVQSDTSDSETEKKDDSLTVDENTGLDHPRKSEFKPNEYNEQVQLDLSDSNVLNSEVDFSTLDIHQGQDRPGESVIQFGEYIKQEEPDISDGDVLNLEVEKHCDSPTVDKRTPRKSETNPSECDEQVQLDASELNLKVEELCGSPIPDNHTLRKSDTNPSEGDEQAQLDASELNLKVEEQCDSPIPDNHTLRNSDTNPSECDELAHLDASELNLKVEEQCDSPIPDNHTPRQLEIKPSECDDQVQFNASESDTLNLEVEKRCESPTPNNSEINPGEHDKQVQLDVLNLESEKQCEPSTLKEHTGLGSSRKSEIKSSECKEEVQLETSDSDVLNLETEKQCDSSTLDKSTDHTRKLEVAPLECNKQIQLDGSDSDVLNLETEKQCDPSSEVQFNISDGEVLNLETEKQCDPPTLHKHTGRGRPRKSEIKLGNLKLDTSDSEVLNLETEKQFALPTLHKQTGRGRPRKSEIKSSGLQLDTSDSDVLSLETKKQCDPPILHKHTGRGRPRKSEIKPSDLQLDTTDSDVLNLETAKLRVPPILLRHSGRGCSRKLEIKPSDLQLDISDSDVLSLETKKQCDPPTLHKHTGRGRRRKSEIKPSEVQFTTTDTKTLNSETEKQCNPSTSGKHRGRGRRRKAEIKPVELTKRVTFDTSDSDVLNSGIKRKARGRPRLSDTKPNESNKRIKLSVLHLKTERRRGRSILHKRRGRGRPKKLVIKLSERNKQQIKLDTGDSDLLNSEIEKQRNSSTLGNHASAKSEKSGSLHRTSTVTSTLVKKLRGRRGRKSIIEKTKVSEGAIAKLKTDSPIPGSPKFKSTPTLLRKSTKESKPAEKRLRSYSKILSEKMNSAEKNLEKPYKKQKADHKASSKKDLRLKSVNISERESSEPPIVEKKRRGRPKTKVQAGEESNPMINKIDPEPDVENKSERKGRGRSRKTQELTDNKPESSERVSPKKFSKSDDKIEVKKKRGRPKRITNDNSDSTESKAELGKSKIRSESKKPKIAEVNLSEDRVSSDNEMSNSNLNSFTDPLDIESIPDNEPEVGSNTNSPDCAKDSPNDTPEKKIKTTVKKRRGRPKAVVSEAELKCEVEMRSANTDTVTESKFMEKEKNTYEAEPKKDLEIGDVKPQKRRGRKRKILAPEKMLEESNNVTCAVCKSVLQESQWITHNELKHNNLAWKTNEVPLDLSDQTLVERILSDLHESKKVLHCELCECEIQTLPDYAEHKKNCTHKPDDASEPAAKKKLISSVLDSLFSNISTPAKKEESAATESTFVKDDAAVMDNNFVEEILPPLGANDIRCAVCKDVMPKGQWPSHKQRKHNNLAWKVGDKPLDLNDRPVVMRILTDLCKSKKVLSCEVCGVGKKSVLGYLSHRSQCQKSDSEINALKVKCTLCGRSMLPVSLQRHIALSHSVNVMETDSPSLEPTVPESDPQGKRKAANKAAGLIHSFAKDMLNEVSSAKFKKYVKNVNFRSVEAAIYKFSEDIQKQSYTECVFDECNYRTSEHEDLFYHIENCDKNSDTNYTCNFCLATFRIRQNVRDHIKLLHGNNENHTLISQFSDNEFNSDSEDGYENDFTLDSEFINAEGENFDFLDVDIVTRPRKTQQALSSGKSSNRIHFLQKKTKKPQNIYLNAYWWMEKFCQENYRLQNCFPRIYCKKEDWVQLDPTQIINYLPKLRYSIDTARIKGNNVINPICYEYVWKKYKLFESEALSDDGSSIFFCGGPINALAWVPTPHTESNCDQILAVSVSPDPDEKYNTNALYKDAGLIQFWNIGVLHNRKVSTHQPKLEFSIAHHYGLIWAMEWCPSGCYDLIMTDDVRRLGLLAIACSNSFVYIYLVPQPGQVSGSIFKTKPTYKLQLENFTDLTLGEIDYYSTRLSWCKTYGHQFLAVGYSNGVVAVYDLKTQASLLKTESDGIITLQPVQKFRAHLDAITALCLYHLHDGKRWLLTGSLDRDCKLWDLENISEPIYYCKKFVITDAVWLVHWLCSVYSYDHGCISGAVPTSLNPARDFFASCTSFMPSNSRVTSITANDWANLFIQANDCGEVICGFPDQLLQGYDCDKKKSLRKSRCLASYTGMVPKSIAAPERIRLETAKLQTLKSQHSNSSAGKSLKKQSAHPDVNNESYEARTYFEAERKYGLVFCDLNMDYKLKEPTVELDKLLQSTHYFSLAKPDMYPLQSITKVSSNPNKNSFLYYACGYQVGIVRVSNLRFLCPENV